MTEKTYKKVTKELMLESAEFPDLNAGQFKEYAQGKINEFLKELPTNVDYIVQDDLKPLGVNCLYLYVGATPAVLQVTQYIAKTQSLLVHLRADYIEVIQPAAEVTNG